MVSNLLLNPICWAFHSEIVLPLYFPFSWATLRYSSIMSLFFLSIIKHVLGTALKSWHAHLHICIRSRFVSVDCLFPSILAPISCFFGCLVIFCYMLDIVMIGWEYVDSKGLDLHERQLGSQPQGSAFLSQSLLRVPMLLAVCSGPGAWQTPSHIRAVCTVLESLKSGVRLPGFESQIFWSPAASASALQLSVLPKPVWCGLEFGTHFTGLWV